MPTINHVFVLMLENRSYDNVFGWSNFSGVTPDGAPTTANGLPVRALTNVGRGGTTYSYGQTAPYFLGFDPGHEFTDVCVQLCGPSIANPDDVQDDRLSLSNGVYPPLVQDITATGFCASYEDLRGNVADAFGGFTPAQLPVLNFLAQNYAVCDSWFSSMPGPTWPNRFFTVAGTSSGLDNSPNDVRVLESIFAGVPHFNFPNGTVFSKMAPADWQVVQGDVAQVQAIAGMKDHSDRIIGMPAFLSQLSAGTLGARFIFIEPEYDAKNDFRTGNSMHPAGDVRRGEALLKTLYDALTSSKYWADSVLAIVFDEHGGFFDHVRPPPALPPNSPENPELKDHNFSFDRYGVRVPAIIVSPFVRAGTIDHTLYDHTSILKTTDRLLGLNGALDLTSRVHAANDFTKILTLAAARTDVPACPAPIPVGDDQPTSSGTPRAKDPFLPLYAHH